jgi:cytidylate kinase
MIVAIDGPSGAGKSTLAKTLARRLGFTYLDTGAIYRALALKLLRLNIDLSNEAVLADVLRHTDIDLRENGGSVQVLLDKEDVSALIRSPDVSQMASKASALKIIRHRLLDLQRAVGRRSDVVAEGRDIGTVVFPQADVKIYLDASVEERARRRFDELRAAGRDVTLSDTIHEMQERDQRDSQRDLAPLCRADDAVVLDSSGIDAGAVAERVLRIVQEKSSKNKNDRSFGT